MPSSVGSAVLLLGLILAVLGFAIPAVVFGALGVAWEGFLFYLEGRT